MAEQTLAPISDEEFQRFLRNEAPQAPPGSIQNQEIGPTEQYRYKQLGIEEKVYSGKTLTKEDLILLDQYGSPAAKAVRQGQMFAKDVMTETAPAIAEGLAAMTISGYTTLLGGQVGLGLARGRMLGNIGQGFFRLIGSMSGAAAGSEVNQSLGLERDSNWNTGAAALMAGAGWLIGRIPKSIAKGTVAARYLRSEEMRDIARQMPIGAVQEQVEREMGMALPGLTGAGLQNQVNYLYNSVRAMPPQMYVDLENWATTYLRNAPRATVNRIIGELRTANPNLARRISFIARNNLFGNSPTPLGLYNFSPNELVDFHQYLTNLRDSWVRSGGARRVANRIHAFRLDRLIDRLDESLTVQANMGNQLAADYGQAARMARLNFARQGIATQLERNSVTFGAKNHYGREINIGRFNAAVERAREMNRTGRPHPLGNFVRLLDAAPGGFAQWQRDIHRIMQLAPENNVQFFGDTIGFVARGGAMVAEMAGINALSELLMTGPGRQFMIQYMEVKGPTFAYEILAPALAGIRSGLFGMVTQPEMNVIQQVRGMGQFIKSQTLGRMGFGSAPSANPELQQQGAPQQQQQPQLPLGAPEEGVPNYQGFPTQMAPATP